MSDATTDPPLREPALVLPSTRTHFPFYELPGIGGLSLLCWEGTRKSRPPLTSPCPTFLENWDQDMGGLSSEEWPCPPLLHSTFPYLASTGFSTFVSPIKGNFGLLCRL